LEQVRYILSNITTSRAENIKAMFQCEKRQGGLTPKCKYGSASAKVKPTFFVVRRQSAAATALLEVWELLTLHKAASRFACRRATKFPWAILEVLGDNKSPLPLCLTP